jgi:CubicO group peptidase (beta-lactamase class C family)
VTIGPALRWGLRVLLAIVVLLAAATIWKWDDIQRLRAVNTLFAEDRIVANFSGMDRLFFHAEIPRGPEPPSPLPVRPRPLPVLSPWVQDRAVTAIVVLHDGAIAYEDYFLGTAPEDRRISWSVAKSLLSALFGILLEEGAISDIDAPVTRYVPALVGTAYDGASIRNVLQMASGVRFNEDYFDFHSDINRMGRVLAFGGSMDRFAASLTERDRPPGVAWQYVSIDTHVIGMVIRGATGRSVIDLMGEKLLQPLRLDSTPYYLTDGRGVAFVLGGLNMTTRDYARFGQLFLQDGAWEGQQIVPHDWVRASTAPTAPTAGGATGYGYQWWIPADAADGEFFARGIYGQFIYINRPAGVVIAVNSADRGFGARGAFGQSLDMFRRIATGAAEDRPEERAPGP